MITPIYLQLNHKKNNNNKLFTHTQETNTTDKIDDKTKSIVNQQHQNENNKNNRNNYYLIRYESYFHKKLVIKFNILPHEYNLIQLDNFITAKYCHSLASFKEKLIYNDNEEFLNKYSKINDSVKKIPLFAEFYKSYLHFFCFPTFAELRLNDLFEEIVENKAKIFYNENYKEENKEDKIEKNASKSIYSIIFTHKIRQNISRKNTLIDLSKTSINNSLSNRNSLNSFKTINKIMDFLDNKNFQNNLTLKNERKNFNLFKKEEKQDNSDKEDFIKGKIKKLDLDNNNRLIAKDNNCITDRNSKKINNSIYIKSTEKKLKTNKNSKNNLIQIIKNQYLTNKLNVNKKFNKYKYKKLKKVSLNKNTKNIKKLSKMKNFCNSINNNEESKIPLKNKKSGSRKINAILNIKNIKANKIEKGTGNNTARERRNYIPKIKKNHIKGLLDNKLHTFLKIALNFRKSPPKKRATLLLKNINNKDSKRLLTDRNKNKSYKIKNKININSNTNSNLTEYIGFNKKNSLNSLLSKSKQVYHLSRNYKAAFDDIKTISIKTSFQKSLLKETYKTNVYNSSKKKLVPCIRFKNINKISSSKNKTQTSLKSRDNTNSLVKKEKSYLTNISLSHLYFKGKKNKEWNNFKTINIKKSFLHNVIHILFGGKGVSQDHSDAIRIFKGVKNAVQYTVPVEDSVNSVRKGENPNLSTRHKHLRECFVVLEEGAIKEEVEKEIKTMKNYFDDYDTTVNFISEEELKEKHSKMPHGGFVIRS